MLDPAGLAPTAVRALRPWTPCASNDDACVRVVLVPLDKPVADGPGLRAERNGHGATTSGVARWSPSTAARRSPSTVLPRSERPIEGRERILLADLIACGAHTDPAAGLNRPTSSPRPSATCPRRASAAEAELARLDALVCQLAEARRRYAADNRLQTPGAWSKRPRMWRVRPRPQPRPSPSVRSWRDGPARAASDHHRAHCPCPGRPSPDAGLRLPRQRRARGGGTLGPDTTRNAGELRSILDAAITNLVVARARLDDRVGG